MTHLHLRFSITLPKHKIISLLGLRFFFLYTLELLLDRFLLCLAE